MEVDALMVQAGEGPSRASVWHPQNEPWYTSTVEGKSELAKLPLISPAGSGGTMSAARCLLRPSIVCRWLLTIVRRSHVAAVSLDANGVNRLWALSDAIPC